MPGTGPKGFLWGDNAGGGGATGSNQSAKKTRKVRPLYKNVLGRINAGFASLISSMFEQQCMTLNSILGEAIGFSLARTRPTWAFRQLRKKSCPAEVHTLLSAGPRTFF